MAIYPNSNLPTASQPWGRAIQNKVETIDSQFLAERTNNTARDAQLQASYTRLDATSLQTIEAVATAQEAIDAITGLGSTGSLYNIYGDNITGGTITGTTVQTSTSGSRIILDGTTNTLKIFYGGSQAAEIYGGFTDGANGLLLNATGTTSNIGISSGGVSVTSGGSDILVQTGAITISGDTSIINDLSTYGVNEHYGVNTFLSTTNVNAQLNSYALTANGILKVEGTGSYVQALDTYTRNVQSGRIMYVSSAGTYNCATSSARYKQDITDYKVDLEKFLKLQPVTFRYKQAVEQDGEAAKIASGFIAEQADEIGMGQFVDYEPDPAQAGKIVPDNFRYLDFASALHSAIAQQQDIIKALTSRIEILEGK
jgi:hypothetical protein